MDDLYSSPDSQSWLMRPDRRNLNTAGAVITDIHTVLWTSGPHRVPSHYVRNKRGCSISYNDCYILEFVLEPPVVPGNEGLIIAKVYADTGEYPLFYWRGAFWNPMLLDEDDLRMIYETRRG